MTKDFSIIKYMRWVKHIFCVLLVSIFLTYVVFLFAGDSNGEIAGYWEYLISQTVLSLAMYFVLCDGLVSYEKQHREVRMTGGKTHETRVAPIEDGKNAVQTINGVWAAPGHERAISHRRIALVQCLISLSILVLV